MLNVVSKRHLLGASLQAIHKLTLTSANMSIRRSTRLSTGPAVNTADAAIPRAVETGGRPAAKANTVNGVATPAMKKRGRKPAQVPLDDTLADETKASQDADGFAIPAAPATPANKRRKVLADDAAPAPFQHSPSAIGLPTKPSATNNRRTKRPAEPHATNALLKTPKGSKVAAYTEADHILEGGLIDREKKAHAQAKNGIPLPTTDTDRLLEEACKHLIAVDTTGKMKVLVDQHHCRIFSPEGLAEEIEPFRALASSIMGQQVSGAAAASIKNKFVNLFPNAVMGPDEEGKKPFPTPEQVAAMEIATLRTAGLSQRKAEYIKGLAEKFAAGELTAKMLATCSYEELLEKLIAVRGLGKWSVEMFACFGLKRMDVFSTGDLGVQ